jgi:predicted LPLAT superfamily acyltransferase
VSELAAASRTWRAQPERSSPGVMRLMVWLALWLGRPFARLLLYPLAAYFLCTGGHAAEASRRFLRHVLSREPRWSDRLDSWHTYAAVLLDRIYLLKGHGAGFSIGIECDAATDATVHGARGAVILVSHFGSFDVMRVMGRHQQHLPLRIVLDRRHGAMATALLETLDPELARGVIDAAQRGPQLVLALKQALDQGELLGLMGDRAQGQEPTVEVPFMGRPASFPEGPWVLASVLKVPVVLAFGVYEGGNRYRIALERLADQVVLPRAQRHAAIAAYAGAYAARLEAQVRRAPHNWFNYYDFWTDEAAAR